MKNRFLSTFMVGCILSMILSPFTIVGAATSTNSVVQFEVIAPATARVNEAVDITVRALDKDKKVVTSYIGSIIFLPDRAGDTVPMQGRGIAFTREDNGEKKFSKGVIFKSPGPQKIYITDVSDDISGEAAIKVEVGTTTTTTSSGSTEEVTLITPQNNTQITSDLVMISGKTRKNSKVILNIDGKESGNTMTDENGLFTKSLS
jgi:hypothetical protein